MFTCCKEKDSLRDHFLRKDVVISFVQSRDKKCRRRFDQMTSYHSLGTETMQNFDPHSFSCEILITAKLFNTKFFNSTKHLSVDPTDDCLHDCVTELIAWVFIRDRVSVQRKLLKCMLLRQSLCDNQAAVVGKHQSLSFIFMFLMKIFYFSWNQCRKSRYKMETFRFHEKNCSTLNIFKARGKWT